MRDPGALDLALARPKYLAACDKPDAAALVAAYIFGIAGNHAIVDGNKPTGWLVVRVFLAGNGHRPHFNKADAVHPIKPVAAGALSE